MWNKIIIVLVLTLLSSTSVMAQSAFFDRKQLTTDAARTIVDTCLAFAAERNAVVGVAVVDMSGVLMDFHVMQAGGATTAETAILKAERKLSMTLRHQGRSN